MPDLATATPLDAPAATTRSNLGAMVRLDLLTIKSMRNVVLFLMAIGAVLATFGVWAFTMPMVAILTVLTIASVVGGGETLNLRLLYGALPVSRRTVITAHYVVAIGTLCVSTIPLVVGGLLAGLLGNEQPPRVEVLGIMAVTAMIVPFLIPAYVKWGQAKAGLIVMAAAFTLGGLGALANAFAKNTTMTVPEPPAVSPWWLAVAIPVAYLASSLVSVRIYEHQDH